MKKWKRRPPYDAQNCCRRMTVVFLWLPMMFAPIDAIAELDAFDGFIKGFDAVE